jgi:mannonate dehydratase
VVAADRWRSILTSRRCDAAYDALARLDMPLLVHLGEEEAVAGGASQGPRESAVGALRPLDRGVRVIVAHCGSLGERAISRPSRR